MKSITSVTCGLIGALNLAGWSRKSPQAGPAAPEVLVIEAATRDVPANEQVQEILNKRLEQRPEEIELILADGSTFRNKARLLAVDRQAVLLLSAERLMDGWGWTPISNGSRSDALDRRIYREVFPNSAWFKP